MELIQKNSPVKTHKAMRGRLVVAVNMNQKDDFEIELAPGLRLWMNKDWGADGKVTNPSMALVKSVGESITDIAAGDVVLVNHNSFKRIVANGYRFGHIGKMDKMDLFSLEYSMVWLKVDPHGNAHPINGYLTVERLEKPIDTKLVVPDIAKKNYKSRFKVVEVGPDIEDLAPGMVIETFDKSDVDVFYTWNHKEKSVVRIAYRDVLLIHDQPSLIISSTYPESNED